MFKKSTLFKIIISGAIGFIIGISAYHFFCFSVLTIRKNTEPEYKQEFFRTNTARLLKIAAIPKEIDITKTAIIIVDMQNAFASKGGMLDKLDIFSDRNRKIIQRIQKVLKSARVAGIKIIYLRMVYHPDLSNAGGTESPNYWKETGIVAMREKPEFRGKFITEGTWDSEIIEELKPQPRDIIVNKSRYSGFVNSELHTILQTYNIKYLIFVGIAANVCVESTIRDAYFHEYFPILVSDCVAPVGPDYIQNATIFNVEKFFGWVTTSENLIKSIPETGKK